MNFTLKIVKRNLTTQRVRTHSIRRFFHHLRTINWGNNPQKVYLRVSYGRYKDAFGKKVAFYNDGWYDSKNDLWSAFKAFKEG